MLWYAFLCLCIAATTGALSEKPKVVVISLGGYRKEILSNVNSVKYAPKVKQLQKEWSGPDFMMPVYPTKGTVNHISMATGYFAEDHGVLDECVYDEPDNKCEFGEENTTKLPIWIENQLQGGTSGVIDWPGSDKEYDGIRPSYIENYTRYEEYSIKQDKNDINRRVETIITWLKHKNVNLVMAYYNGLDKVLHENPVHKWDPSYLQIGLVDKFVSQFIDSLKREQIDEHINVIILGSHGVVGINQSNCVDLGSFLNKDNSRYESMGSYAIITPRYGHYDEVCNLLEKNRKVKYNGNNYYNRDNNNKEFYYIYKTTKDIPAEWHLKESPLIERMIFLAANYSFFFWNEYLFYIYNEKYEPYEMKFEASLGGYPLNQGVDEFLKTIFMAKGPRINPKKVVRDFKTIDVYPLLRELLNLPNNDKQEKRLEEMNDAVRDLLYIPSEQQAPEKENDDIDTAKTNGHNLKEKL